MANNFVDPDLVSAVLDLRPGDHLCLVYNDDPAEQLPAILPFLRQGLVAGEQCVYVADDHTIDDFREALEDYGVDVKREEANGSLLLWTRDQWRQPGELSSERKAEQVRAVMEQALADGYNGVRFGVEMTWTLGPDIDAGKLRHWEATINTIFTPEAPGRIICQYSRRRLTPEAIQAGICTHPVAIIGDEVCPNPFYEGPLILRGKPYGSISSPEQVDWLISQLRWAHAYDREREQRQRAERLAAEALLTKQLYDDLHQVTARLEESEADLRDFFDNGVVALHWVGPEGTILRVNRAELDMLGYSGDEYVGHNIAEFHAESETISDILARLSRGEILHEYESQLICKDGTLKDVLIDSSVLWRDGEFIHTRCFTRDVTEQKRSAAAIRQSLAVKDQFLGLVSHELRTPISTILGNSQLLFRKGDVLQEVDKKLALQDIVAETERLQRIIENLLILTRLDSGRELHPEPLHVLRLAEDVVAAFKRGNPLRPISLQIQGEIPFGYAESFLISLVMDNLITNAIKYSDASTEIEVNLVQNSEGRAEFHVLDRGIGFNDDETEKLFEPFYRSKEAASTAGGMGVGLSVCKKIVEAQGGIIGARPRQDGGAEFFFSIPTP